MKRDAWRASNLWLPGSRSPTREKAGLWPLVQTALLGRKVWHGGRCWQPVELQRRASFWAPSRLMPEPAFPKRYNPTFDSGRFVLESPFSRWEEEDELRHRKGLGPAVDVVGVVEYVVPSGVKKGCQFPTCGFWAVP